MSTWVKEVVEAEPAPVKIRARSETPARLVDLLHPKIAARGQGVEVDPHAFGHQAVDLGHPHLQHHLLDPAHVHHVHHLILLTPGKGQGQGQSGALGHRPRDLPGQDDGVPRGLRPDLLLGQDLVELLF